MHAQLRDAAPALQALGLPGTHLWHDLGNPVLDQATVELRSQQADFGAPIAELESARDQARTRVMRALEE